MRSIVIIIIKTNIEMKKSIIAVFLILTSIALYSCKTQQVELTYFLDAQDGAKLGGSDYEIRVVPDDELLITVNSLVPAATAQYNLPLSNPSSREAVTLTSTPKLQTYLVDKSGYIEFPVLGKLKVEGKTTEEIKTELEAEISKTVDKPFVRVQLVNFKVNVIGEVNTPMVIEVKSERFSVLDAIAAAGDLSVFGLRDQVYVIREQDGSKTFHKLDLTDAQIVASPYFYLRQNDVVYVAPNKIRIDNSKYNQNNAYKLTVISTIVSAASVIASLVIALAVK